MFCLRCVRAAPAPVELASVCRVKVYPQSGKANTFGEVRARLSCTKACSWSCFQGMTDFLARLDAKSLFLRMFVSGAAIMLCISTNWRRYPVSPRKARSSSTLVGRGMLVTTSSLEGAGRMPVLSTTIPKYSWDGAAKLHFAKLTERRAFKSF